MLMENKGQSFLVFVQHRRPNMCEIIIINGFKGEN